MSTGTGNLPNQNMDFVPLATLSAADLDKLVDNIEALADGTGIGDGSVVTAKIADANVTNAKLAGGAGQPGGAWTGWTPSFTNFTLGNGTVDYARYTQIGKTVLFELSVTLGSTSSVSGAFTFTAPVAVSATYSTLSITPIGDATLRSSTSSTGVPTVGPSNTIIVRAYSVSGSNINHVSTSATVPFTWATGHAFIVSGAYQAA
jgi:hypothetical protein